jgi:glycerophosphoryl diester phosphodiesterase
VDLAVLLLKLDNKLNKKMIKYSFKLLLIFLLFTACKVTKIEASNAEKIIALSERSQKVRDYVKKDIVIAHRGTTYWAPEETQPAFLWARNIGADYLEFDIQQTKDGKLVAFHDKDLIRTTNVEAIFPERAKSPINDFSLKN